MKIETKFNIGDDVWFYQSGKTDVGKIVNLQIFIFNDSEIQIRYKITGYFEPYNEKFLFSSKQELLEN